MSNQELLNEIFTKPLNQLKKQELVEGFTKLSNLLNVSIAESKETTENCKSKIEEINTIKNEADTIRNEANTMKGEATAIKDKATAIKDEATAIKGEATAIKDEATAIKGEATAIKDAANTIKDEVDTIKTKYNEDFKNILDETKKIKSDLEDTPSVEEDENSNETTDSDTGESKPQIKIGLVTKIKELHKEQEDEYQTLLGKVNNEHQTLSKRVEDEYQTLYEKIESLLPDAATAGLAEDYQKAVNRYNKSDKIWTQGFIVSIIAASIISVTNLHFLEDLQTWGDASKFISSSAALIWLTYFCSKRRSESKRLAEEYQHKLSIAKTYVGYEREVEDKLGKTNPLIKDLLTVMIEASAYNPSITLETKHGDKMPLLEMLEKTIGKTVGKAIRKAIEEQQQKK